MDTSRDILARAIALLSEGIEAAIREGVEAANKPADGVIDAVTAARESGYQVQSVSRLCRLGFIASAYRSGRRWKFLRSDWTAYLMGKSRRRFLEAA